MSEKGGPLCALWVRKGVNEPIESNELNEFDKIVLNEPIESNELNEFDKIVLNELDK